MVTANTGGMSEYVHHEVNGLLFEHRSVEDMAKQMQRMVDNHSWAAEMGVTALIPSTLGEPLLYRNFDLILDLCEELDLKINLTTNGTFPSPEKEKNVEYWAKRITPIGSDVKISWNGATAKTQEQIMPRSSFTPRLSHDRISHLVRFLLYLN